MPEEPSFQKFTLPPKINVPRSRDPVANEKLLKGIMGEAFRNSVVPIEKTLEKLDEPHVKRLKDEAEVMGQEPYDFLYSQFKHISGAYTGYRTGLAEARDPETGMDVTKESISTTLTFLSYLIGSNLTEQFFKTKTKDIDTVLEQRFGRQK